MKQTVKAVEIAAVASQRIGVEKYLAHRGVFEPADPGDTGSLTAEDTTLESAQLARDAAAVDKTLEILSKVGAKQKKGLAGLLAAPDGISGDELRVDEEVLGLCRGVEEKLNRINDLRAKKLRAENSAALLEPWRGLDVDPCAKLPEGVVLLTGTLAEPMSRERIMEKLAAEEPSLEEFGLEVVSKGINQTCVAAVCLKDRANVLESALRSMGFSRFTPPTDKTPAQAADDQLARAAELEAQAKELVKECESLKPREDEIRLLSDALAVKQAALDARPMARADGSVVYYRGWATETNAGKLKKGLEKNFDAEVSISDPAPDEDVPVVLKNNGFAAPLEGITAMYSLPGKEDIDPTGIMAFFYYFFFGMMFSDGGYGLLMTLGCAFALLKYGKVMPRSRKNSVKMYLFCGISTTFWGAMYGSWFGDMINVVRTDILGKEALDLAIWKDPLQDLLSVLVICFIFGLVHLFTGVLLKGITDLKNGRKFDAFCDTVPTFLMVLGLAPIFFQLFIEKEKFPSVFLKIMPFFLIPGLILVILTGGRESKGIGGKIALGLYSVYDLFGGYLGDVLSYARLLALGLATGVIAQVINMLCVLPGSKALRIVMLIVVGAVGHLANFAINVIGAYVHTNRLQYVEFFGKFYSGGGRPLAPIKGNTRYYTVKEEISS